MKQLVILISLLMSSHASTAQNNCEPIIKECIVVIEAAKRSIQELHYKSQLEQQLIQDRERSIKYLQDELDGAKVWYKKPEFVAPIAFFIGLSAGALLKGR